MTSRWEQLDTRKVALGLGLATIGVIALLGQFHAWDFWKLWPLWLGFIGIGKLMAHPSEADYADGVLMLALCFLFLSVNYHWLGLTWRNSWPLFIVFAGLSMVLGSFHRARRRRTADEDSLRPFVKVRVGRDKSEGEEDRS